VPTWAHSRLQIALMFTHDKGVVETLAALCGWVAIVVVGDGLNAVYSGQHQLACATVPQAWRWHALWCCSSVPCASLAVCQLRTQLIQFPTPLRILY
jgi:hypothetical protein